MLNILCSKNNPFLPLCEDLVFSMANFFFSTVLSVLYLCLLSFTKAAPQAALITHLPGFNGTLPSKHYSGYVTLDAKNLFYYLVVSERKPSEDPVVLWLNGGPGCSSFDGFVYEHGPFNFEAGKTPGSLPKLHLNPNSWSKVSNILYLDSPAGVGLSYSDNEHDYTTGDNKTASDTHTFLLKWFEQYPEFLSNPFFISGESYAGVYVPTLAAEVVKGLDAGVKPVLNLKGYIIGNGVTDKVFDGNALVPFAHGMGLISDDLYQEANIACQGNYWDSSQSVSCEEKLEKVDAGISGLNIYDILEPCYHSSEARKIETSRLRFPSSFQQLGETDRPLAVRKRIFGRAWPYRAPVREGFVPSWPQLMSSSGVPCVNDEVANAWLNNDAVRKALHARQNLTWDLCTGQINYYSDAGSMINFHKNLTARGYRALIFSAYQSDKDKDLAVILPTRKTICQVYFINRTILFVITDSGDHDMCVPYTGSEAWTRSLGYKIVDEWRPWFLKDEIAGFTQGYDHNLTFLTVKGSGHTVPEYKPREALAFYSRWLAGEKI